MKVSFISLPRDITPNSMSSRILTNIVWDLRTFPMSATKKKLCYTGLDNRSVGDIECRVPVKGGNTRMGCIDNTEFFITRVIEGPARIKFDLFYTRPDSGTYTHSVSLDFDNSSITLSSLLNRIHSEWICTSPAGTSYHAAVFRGLEKEDVEDGKQVYTVLFEN